MARRGVVRLIVERAVSEDESLEDDRQGPRQERSHLPQEACAGRVGGAAAEVRSKGQQEGERESERKKDCEALPVGSRLVTWPLVGVQLVISVRAIQLALERNRISLYNTRFETKLNAVGS